MPTESRSKPDTTSTTEALAVINVRVAYELAAKFTYIL